MGDKDVVNFVFAEGDKVGVAIITICEFNKMSGDRMVRGERG